VADHKSAVPSDTERRAEAIFTAAAALSGPARAALLAERCAGDAALHAEIESLLREHDADASFLEPVTPTGMTRAPEAPPAPPPAPVQADAHLDDELEEHAPGTFIADYRLVRRLGSGGMGDVWLAEQVRPLRRLVALKVIKPGMDSRSVVARFQTERQALALMQHPSVAKVLDAGQTDRGRPYFVMEYVAGPAITKFCDDKKLSVDRRLDLFLAICDAVQHAHHKGVIHRDLKPGNILVDTAADTPVPKVIDFGIAKALSRDAAGVTVLTEHGQLMGTPEYMSPEQAGLAGGGGIGGGDVDTRTDVYSLGVILYELLTGATPLASAGVRFVGLAELQRILDTSQPSKPSTRLTGARQRPAGAPAALAPARGPAEIAALRATTPAALARRLRGDLDWIAMKALEKDRSRRYATVHDLAEDIRRHLRHEPVTAGPPTVLYLFSRFARRHRVLLAAGSAVAVALVAGLISTGVALRQAQESAGAAQREAASAAAARDFLQNMLEAASPEHTLGHEMTIREVLDRAAGKADSREFADPRLEADVRAAIGRTYLSLGRIDDARKNLDRALAIRRDLPRDRRALIGALRDLAGLDVVAGNFDTAEALLREAVTESRRESTDMRPLAASLSDLGNALRANAKYQEAEAALVEAAALIKDRSDLKPSEVAGILSNHGLLLIEMERDDEAERLLLEALRLEQAGATGANPMVARATMNLAGNHLMAGRYDRAEPLFREAVRMYDRLLPPEHSERATALATLGWTLVDGGKPAEAEPFLREALRIRRKSLPADHWHLASSMNLLAASLAGQRKFEEAEPLMKEGTDGMLRSDAPPDRIRRAVDRAVKMYDAWGKKDEAEAWRARVGTGEGAGGG
jgi:serine/threonine protein kinase/Tfp pilus assembly protein PilF